MYSKTIKNYINYDNVIANSYMFIGKHPEKKKIFLDFLKIFFFVLFLTFIFIVSFLAENNRLFVVLNKAMNKSLFIEYDLFQHKMNYTKIPLNHFDYADIRSSYKPYSHRLIINLKKKFNTTLNTNIYGVSYLEFMSGNRNYNLANMYKEKINSYLGSSKTVKLIIRPPNNVFWDLEDTVLAIILIFWWSLVTFILILFFKPIGTEFIIDKDRNVFHVKIPTRLFKKNNKYCISKIKSFKFEQNGIFMEYEKEGLFVKITHNLRPKPEWIEKTLTLPHFLDSLKLKKISFLKIKPAH